MESLQFNSYLPNMIIPNQEEIDKLKHEYYKNIFNKMPDTGIKNIDQGIKLIDAQQLIWVGDFELHIILKLLEGFNYCCQSQTHSGGVFRLIYRFTNNEKHRNVNIPKKPAIILKTIKKRTEFYVSYERLPLSMELDFEKIKYKNRTPKWRWLGDPKIYQDLTRLGDYIKEIFSTQINLENF